MRLATSIRGDRLPSPVCATLSLRAFLPSGDSGGCNPSPLHLHSIRELRPIGPPRPCRVASSFVLLPLSASSSSPVLLVPLIRYPLRPSSPPNCFNIFALLIVLFLWCLSPPIKFSRPSLLHLILFVVFLLPTSARYLLYIYSFILGFLLFFLS